MNPRESFVFFLFICCVLSTCGCVQPAKENSQPNQKNQEAISELITRINSSAPNYDISYKKTQDIMYYSPYSAGGADEIITSGVSLGVRDGAVANYTMGYSASWGGYGSENYSEYYNASQNETCTEQIVSGSDCNVIPISQTLGGNLTGCKDDLSPDGYGKCICNNFSMPISDLPGFACSENINTDNMTERYIWAFYYPEANKSFCYIEAKDNADQLWAIECNQNIILAPLITNNTEPLTDVKCFEDVGNQPGEPTGFCSCTFYPVNTLSCTSGTPANDYQSEKQNMTEYLQYISDNDSQDMSTVSEENNGYGHCYLFFYSNLMNTFCFDEQNLVTFAQWGSNVSGTGFANIDINTIERSQ